MQKSKGEEFYAEFEFCRFFSETFEPTFAKSSRKAKLKLPEGLSKKPCDWESFKLFYFKKSDFCWKKSTVCLVNFLFIHGLQFWFSWSFRNELKKNIFFQKDDRLLEALLAVPRTRAKNTVQSPSLTALWPQKCLKVEIRISSRLFVCTESLPVLHWFCATRSFMRQ